MKILEISGCNLASIRGEFKLELDQPPFKETGLFAIRGATGSGKSTLIDAMCLALYGRTPRLGGNIGILVGQPGQEESLKAKSNDERTIMQRGTGHCWAEVMFRGEDGIRWRARWSARRARGVASGRLQPAEATLRNEDDPEVKIGGNITEVWSACEQRLGLTYDQFKRSVLLAQGDFAAFVRAREAERSELLEAMTGTGIYSRLSMEAHARHSEEDRRKKVLEERRNNLGVLETRARADLERELEDLRTDIERAQRVAAGAEAEVRWHQRKRELQKRLDITGVDLEEASQRDSGAESRRILLAKVERAQPLAPLLAEFERASGAEQSLIKEIQSKTDSLSAKEQEAGRCQAALREAEALLRETETTRMEAGPALTEAKALDGKIQVAADQVRRAAKDAETLTEERASAEKKLDGLEFESKNMAERKRLLLSDLEACRDLVALEPIWALTSEDLERLAGLYSTNQSKAAALKELEKQLEVLQKQQDSAKVELQAKIEAHQETVSRLEALEGKLAGSPRARLEQDRHAREAEIRALAEAKEHLETLKRLLENQGALQGQVREQSEAVEHADRRAAEAVAALAAIDPTLREAQTTLETAKLALSLEGHRSRLVEGDPCPLCGATHHPWGQGGGLTGDLPGLQSNVVQLDLDRRDHEKILAVQNALQQKALAEKERLTGLLDETTDQIETSIKGWDVIRTTVKDLPEDPKASHSRTLVHEAVLEAEEQLQAVKEAELILRTIETDATQARDQERNARGEEETAKRLVSDLDTKVQRMAVEEGGLTAEVAGLANEIELMLKRLKANLPESVFRGLPGEARAQRKALGERIEEFRALQIELTKAENDGKAITAECATQRAIVQEKREVAERAELSCKAANQVLADLHKSRAAVLDGRVAAEVEATLQDAVTAAGEQVEAARGAHQKAFQELDTWRAGIGILKDQMPALADARVSSGKAFELALAAWGGERDQLPALLAWNIEQIQAERAELAEFRARLDNVQAILRERRTEFDDHVAQGRPDLTEEDADTKFKETREQADAWREKAGSLELLIQQDDEARHQAGILEEEIRAQTTILATWEALKSVIGSADGKEFRSFAQSLTLERLLASANHDLVKLNPRYELQRVPGYNLEIQVLDRDMGGEVRALSSLSGGESFLISLALALGLSSLAASNTAINSLFIDEGFGTLDPQSLEMALSVLEELQAGGRQVGIITHVEGLETHVPVQVEIRKLGGGVSKVISPARRPAAEALAATEPDGGA